jgi:hypothetical protein
MSTGTTWSRSSSLATIFSAAATHSAVIAGLDPAIQLFLRELSREVLDPRVKPGGDRRVLGEFGG